MQEHGSLLCSRCCVSHLKMLHLKTCLAKLACKIEPSTANLLWHSVTPEGLEDELLTVFCLVGKLLNGPLIHCVCVPATIDLEAVKTGFVWNGLTNLVEQLIDCFCGAAPEEL